MLSIHKIHKAQSPLRLALVKVRYYDLIISCDLCLYKREKLWIRMPEIWVTETKKKRFCWWPTPEISGGFQDLILTLVMKEMDLTLEKAIEMNKNFKLNKKKTRQKTQTKVTLME